MKDINSKYYAENADSFIENTFSCDMSVQYAFFFKHLRNPEEILDLGFGSGRDSIYFQSKGIKVVAVDPVEEFCQRGRELGIETVVCASAQTMDFHHRFDGIWACASLLHVNDNELVDALSSCREALKDDGVMYASFKYGSFRGERNGRYFIDLNEETIKPFVEKAGLKIVDVLLTTDVRPENETKWLNLILVKTVVNMPGEFKAKEGK